MQLRLTYQGRLLGANATNTRAPHKHEIRRVFDRQLRRHWELHPHLRGVALQLESQPGTYYPIIPFLESRYARFGWRFVPLVTEFMSLRCSLHVLLLRPDLPGRIISSGDIDNRLKTLFDALRLPQNEAELGGCEVPPESELPMYCLLEDDKLIEHVSVETDVLLEPVGDSFGENDVRIVLTVNLRPYVFTMQNSVFG